MDPIELLMRQARVKRDAAIVAAKRTYRIETQEIRGLKRRMGLLSTGRRRQAAYDRQIVGGDDSCYGRTVTDTVLTILGEGHRLTLVELTLEVQRRGCRARDDSRAVSHAVNAALYHRRQRFRKDDKGRWGVP
jgi:hypothetical protein